MQLDALFRPELIAVIGASEKPTIGRRLIASLDRIGFTGGLFPVNPNYSIRAGPPVLAQHRGTAGRSDAALFCVGHERVLDAFRTAAERGVRAAVIYDGGFAEQSDDGRRLQAKIAAICSEAGIALCGPNCMGVLNPHHPSTTYLQELREPQGLAGNVGIVAQSGAFCVSLLTDIRRFGFSHVVSSGNEAVVTAADYLDYLADDPQTKIIGAFIETIRHPERFAAALTMPRQPASRSWWSKSDAPRAPGGPSLPILAALPAIPKTPPNLLRAHHAIEVGDLVALTEVLAAFQHWKAPAGRRVGVVTSSGGLAELILDLAAAADLHLPPLSTAARAEIESGIGSITGDGNPLDAWGSGTFVTNLPRALALLDASADHDIIAFCRDNCDGQPFDTPELARSYLELFAAAAAQSAKPHFLLHTRPGIMDRAQIARLRTLGLPVVGGLGEGLVAIDRLARWAVAPKP